MRQPLLTAPTDQLATRPSGPLAPAEPRPRVLERGDPMRLDQVVEEQRLARLGIEVLRQLVSLGCPRIDVLAGYIGLSVHDVRSCIDGGQRLPRGARRNLARVALAFAPDGTRHTARRLLEGELARLAAPG